MSQYYESPTDSQYYQLHSQDQQYVAAPQDSQVYESSEPSPTRFLHSQYMDKPSQAMYPSSEVCSRQHQGQVIYGSDLYSQTLGGSDSELFYPSITRPVALEDRGLNWAFEDVAVPASKPLGHQGTGFYHNGSDCYPYEAVPAPELGYCSHHNEESSCYEAEYLLGSRSPPFTPNLHYPYGHEPHATSPAIADEDLAAASEILGRDNWARRQSEPNVVVEKGQCIKTESTEPAVMLRDSHPAASSAMVGRMYYEAGELVQAPLISSSQQPYPESMERHQTTRYSNVVNPSGVYQQPAYEQPEPPIMDHLPFPEESMSPCSYATDSPSVQSPYASQSEPTFAPTPHNHRSQDRNIILASQSTTSTWVCGTKRVRSCSPLQEVDYPMPVIWSPSDSSPTSPPPKKQRLSLSQTRKPLSYGPKGTWSLRSLSPLLSPRMSPAPSKKSKSSDKKLSLACLFCRGRKIACGPPPPGSDGETCNQCFRRQLSCEYPLESRRGMRRKKSSTSKVNSCGPKVTIKASRRQ